MQNELDKESAIISHNAYTLLMQDYNILIITFSGNRHSLAEALGEIIQNDSFIALISNYEKSICSAYADIVFLIPKTEDVKSLEMFQKIAPFAQKSCMEDE